MPTRTPLIILSLLTIALGLQLVALLTVPVSSTMSLCRYGEHAFGVFGFCNITSGACSDISIGYKNTTIDELSGFSLPSNTRQSISRLLVVHPISAGFTLVLLVLAVLVHLVANDLRLLFLSVLWTLPTFLLSLLSFLVDILLFSPHLEWCGWIILGSTVLIAMCGAMLCVMRRSSSSRMVGGGYHNVRSNKEEEGEGEPKLSEDEYYGDDEYYETLRRSSMGSYLEENQEEEIMMDELRPLRRVSS
ncbi:hypothetical protein DASC09_010160 [Saccharomycopsis crataegensis]|uniref:PH-response regulator protein palI/RIM9 n=1 Tax=Saccharomycopsis crataegensis TaxID=43959 RepID=A0AAV5QGG8_9ASCO|nr:hypothetical protein DASC09_010160 [Saccharomycopsis crataegensis]